MDCSLFQTHKPLKGWLRSLSILVITLFFLSSISHAAGTVNQTPKEEGEQQKEQSIEEKWGIKIIGVRLTAEEYMLDFRYRVIHPDQARDLIQKQPMPYLIHQATQRKLAVPRTKMGALRQTRVKPIADRNYIIIFGNTGKTVKRGDKVTVVIGKFKVEDLVVE